MIDIVELQTGRGATARAVLSDLPEWFGRPDSIDAYVDAADALPMLAARAADEGIVGFLSLKQHSPVAVEAMVLGVLRACTAGGSGVACSTPPRSACRAKGYAT